MGTVTHTQNSDSKFLSNYLATKITVEPDSSYSLKFPWKSNHPPLPSNYTICAKRSTPSVFLRVDLVSQINRSQNPPNQGAHFGMNCHWIPLQANSSDNSADKSKSLSYSAAAK